MVRNEAVGMSAPAKTPRVTPLQKATAKVASLTAHLRTIERHSRGFANSRLAIINELAARALAE